MQKIEGDGAVWATGDILKSYGSQGGLNLHTGTGWQPTSRGVTAANRSEAACETAATVCSP